MENVQELSIWTLLDALTWLFRSVHQGVLVGGIVKVPHSPVQKGYNFLLVNVAVSSLNFLFWNVNKRVVNDLLVEVVKHSSVDFLILAEYTDDPAALVHMLNAAGLSFSHVDKIGCQRIDLFCKFSVKQIKHNIEGDRFTVKEIRRTNMERLLLCAVHLPDKRNASDEVQRMFASSVVRDIAAAEKNVKHRHTVVVGDFNMNPFDDGMLVGDAFHAIQCPGMALGNNDRTQWGLTNSFFYNPSWRLLTEEKQTAGTYFHHTPGKSLYWNVLDQVIMRPEVISRFDKNSLKVLLTVGTHQLVSSNGRPSVSDHLPIVFTVN